MSVLPIILTRHAVARAAERLRLSERQLARLMGKIHSRGATRAFMGKDLCLYFDRKLDYNPDAMRESCIHDGHLFVIERGILITIYQVPPGIRALAIVAARENRNHQS